MPRRRSLWDVYTRKKYTYARNRGLKRGEGIYSKGVYFQELTVLLLITCSCATYVREFVNTLIVAMLSLVLAIILALCSLLPLSTYTQPLGVPLRVLERD